MTSCPNRATRRAHSKRIRKIAGGMAKHSDRELQLMAVDPVNRATMERTIGECERVIGKVTSASDKARLATEAARLRHALDNPAVEA